MRDAVRVGDAETVSCEYACRQVWLYVQTGLSSGVTAQSAKSRELMFGESLFIMRHCLWSVKYRPGCELL